MVFALLSLFCVCVCARVMYILLQKHKMQNACNNKMAVEKKVKHKYFIINYIHTHKNQ